MIRPAFIIAGLLAACACGSGDGPCVVDYDCDGIDVCNPSTGKCEPIICKADDECVDPRYECLDNRCILKSSSQSE